MLLLEFLTIFIDIIVYSRYFNIKKLRLVERIGISIAAIVGAVYFLLIIYFEISGGEFRTFMFVLSTIMSIPLIFLRK